MEELVLKYNLLPPLLQKQAQEFIDFLLSTNNLLKEKQLSDYKKKLLDVSVWNENYTNVYNENSKLMQSWKSGVVVDSGIFIEHFRAKDKTKTTLFQMPENLKLFVSK